MARATHPGSLPGELTSFVGRRRELADLRALLGQSRLVTLTGFGGVGKTRLALRVAADAAGVRDGAWLVDLAPVRDPGLVAPTVLATLGIRDGSHDPSVAALADHLRDRRLLLVLDNCEHLLDACAVLADTLLRRTSELRVLATSRQPLGVPGERIFEVAPLPVPDPDAPVPPAKALERYDAVALFVGRARAADLSFAINDDNAEAVTRLAQRLDGIPLALELAAARLRVLSPRQILDRLDDRYHLLTPTLRAVSPRQANLQSLIDWSFDLCTTEEQILWARLSVFPGDFELDAVEEICSNGGVPRERVLPTLSGLVDKSIVTGTRGVGDTVRYRLLETLREYGHRLLVDAGQETELRSRHRDHFRRLAARWSREWFGPGQVKWTHWVQVEQANLRAALEYCLSPPREAEAGLAMVVAMSTYWAHRGSLAEGRRYVDRVLATLREPSAGRADALWTAAWIALNQGDTGTAEAAGEEASALAERFGDVRALGMGLLFRGSARMGRGDVQAAERLFQEALDRAGSDPVVAALALNRSGEAAAQRGDVDTATERLDRCLQLCEEHGDLWIRTGALLSRSMLALSSGDLGTARRTATEALRCRLPFQDRLYVAQCVEALAWVAAAESDHLRAARLLGAARATREAFGSSLFPHLLPLHDRCEEQARGGLGQRDFSRAEQEGSRYGIAEAISYALGETRQTPDSLAARAQVLTRRENEVADLVTEGLSNREIAAKLVLSTRTVEAHVEHILTKMSFTSRSQIAAWVAEQRSAEPS